MVLLGPNVLISLCPLGIIIVLLHDKRICNLVIFEKKYADAYLRSPSISVSLIYLAVHDSLTLNRSGGTLVVLVSKIQRSHERHSKNTDVVFMTNVSSPPSNEQNRWQKRAPRGAGKWPRERRSSAKNKMAAGMEGAILTWKSLGQNGPGKRVVFNLDNTGRSECGVHVLERWEQNTWSFDVSYENAVDLRNVYYTNVIDFKAKNSIFLIY